MTSKIRSDSMILSNKKFVFFLCSQGVSNLGDAFQFMAVTSLLIRITGSGLSAAFGLICTPILSILFSAFAGYISDLRTEKFMLIIIDLLRGFVVILFISKNSIIVIYVLIIILSTLEIIYNPPRRKLMTGILKSNQLQTGNSLLNGLTGVMFIIGPILASIIVSTYGTNIAFYVNSISFFLSAFMISLIKYKANKQVIISKMKTTPGRSINFLSEGFCYCFNTNSLRKIILIGTAICFTTTCINIAFYPYAFDTLKISNKIWGIMMSIFYGANFIAMFISLSTHFKTKVYYKIIIPILLIIISVIWFTYGSTFKIGTILILQLVEGTILSFLNIILTSHLQIKSKKEIIGRVIGINDFINNVGKIFGIGCTYMLLRVGDTNTVFTFCALFIFIFAIYTSVTIKAKSE